MQLSLSSAAAPDLPLADLREVCQRRGLAALELVFGDACLPAAVDERLALEARNAGQRGSAGIAAVAVPERVAVTGRILDLAAWLEVPLVVRAPREADALERLCRYTGEGGRILLLHGSDPAAAAELRALAETLPAGTAALAWEVDPAGADPARVPEILSACGPALQYVRLLGGGPEAAAQSGLGVGALMARLALARFAGPLVLTPSTPRYHYAWRAWLGRTGGWGCGSKQSDPSLVALSGAAGA